MRSADNIRKTIKNIKIKTNPKVSKAVLNDMLDQMDRAEGIKTNAHQSNTWRIIMNNKITKFATAAVFIAVAILSVTLFDKTATPAWAIEDTIKALEDIYSIKMSGNAIDLSTQFEGKYILWALPNEDGTESAEVRFEINDNQISVVTTAGITYTHLLEENTVYIAKRKNIIINPWMGSDFFQTIKNFAENWKISYGKDEETGRDSIFVTCAHSRKAKSWWFQFDSQTKLPVRMKQWTNTDFEGKPQFHAASIEYNPELSDGIFEFEIPEGAKVINLP